MPTLPAIVFSFGDSPALADELAALVVAGTKTATCDVKGLAEDVPVVGQRSIVLDGSGTPVAVIETLEMVERRFDEVDAAFAWDEGEDERTLESWRRNHRVYFERHDCFDPQMMLLCERFRLVEIVPPDADLAALKAAHAVEIT